jgi:enhancing lycopene biosynthesis protein 2
MRRVGVLLSGCGLHDGSDVHETVLLAVALERCGLRAVFLAPEGTQGDVVDHVTGTRDEEAAPREILRESARLARGSIEPLNERSHAALDALVIPGGAGAVRNLCQAGSGPLGAGPLREDVAMLLDGLTARQAPVAGIGLAAVVLARHRDRPLDPTVLGRAASDLVEDPEAGTLWVPGFLGAGGAAHVAEGIDRLAEALAARLGVSPALRLRGGGGTA